MYITKNTVRFSEVDREKRMTLPAVINYFQDCSIFQSEELGVGLENLASHHRAWMLSSWQIVVDRYPAFAEKIEVGTWATGFEGLYGTRNFTMTGQDGQMAVWANSIWVYMDMETGRPVRPETWEMEVYNAEAPLEMEYAPRKINIPKDYEEVPSFPVRRYHIDTNAHVNNAVYVQMAQEVLQKEITVRQVRVDYKRAAVFGDQIYPRITEEKERTVVQLCAKNGRPYAVVEFTAKGENENEVR